VPLTIGLSVLAVILALGISLFYILQQYLVYDQTGVTLQLPFMAEETAAEAETEEAEATPAFEPIAVQVVYEDPDFSQVDLGGWEELTATQTMFVPYADAVDTVKVATAVTSAQEQGLTGLVLELKTSDGKLAWASTSQTATDYGTSGMMDYTETIAALHEKGLTAAAQISCCADELLATRNWTMTLQTISGSAYQDSDGVYWLDPYNRTLRTYIGELMAELAAMGFDEIILADLYHPVSEEGFQYSTTLQTEANPVTAVCQMGRRLVEAMDGTGVAVSVLLDADSLESGNGALTGQDIDIFWRLFARLYCPTTAQGAATDLEIAAETMTQGDASVRFVPVSTTAPDGFSSYCLK
jgi:hypothetical protein